MVLDVKDFLPGQGKTHGTIIRHLKEAPEKVLVLAMPHVTTIEEKLLLARRLSSNMFGYDKSIRAIHSENSKNVGASIEEALKDSNLGILFITHQGYLKTYQTLENSLGNIVLDMVIDEEIPAIRNITLDLNIGTWVHSILPNIIVSEVNNPQLVGMIDNTDGDKNLDKVYEIAVKEEAVLGRLVDEAYSDRMREFWEILADTNYYCYMPRASYDKAFFDKEELTEDKYQLVVTGIVDKEIYRKTTPTLMGAFFKDTLFYTILKQQGVKFNFLEADEYIQRRDFVDRPITLKRYLPEYVKKADGTSTQRETKWSISLAQNSGNLKKIQDAIAVDNPDEPTYYVLNNRFDGTDVFNSKEGYSRATKYEGSNRYINCNTCIFLAAYNSTPSINNFHKLLGINPDRVNESQNNIKIGQAIRGNTRDFEEKHNSNDTPFTVYVPTRGNIEFLERNNFFGYNYVTTDYLAIPDMILSNKRDMVGREYKTIKKRQGRIRDSYIDVLDTYPSKSVIQEIDKVFLKYLEEHGVVGKYTKAFKWAIGERPKRLDMMDDMVKELYDIVNTLLVSLQESGSVILKGVTLLQPEVLAVEGEEKLVEYLNSAGVVEYITPKERDQRLEYARLATIEGNY